MWLIWESTSGTINLPSDSLSASFMQWSLSAQLQKTAEHSRSDRFIKQLLTLHNS